MGLLTTLSKWKRSRRFAKLRKFTNMLYYDPEVVLLRYKNLDTVSVDGCQFYATDQIDLIQRVKGNYWFNGIKETDVVLDLGAHIGAIAIPLAKTAKLVYAVEPLYHTQLENNVKLNGLDNVRVFSFGCGEADKPIPISFSGKSGEVLLKPFSWFRENINEPIDFLKVDIEGYEWDIPRDDLKGIRELRFEFHVRRGHRKQDLKELDKWFKWLSDNGYDYQTEYGLQPGIMAPFCDCLLLSASLELNKYNPLP